MIAEAASPTPMRLPLAEASALTRGVARKSVLVGFSLMVAKAGVWWFSGSVSLLASVADSGLDFVAATATFWAVHLAALPASERHRYGRGKVEAFASLLQAALVFTSAALIGREAFARAVAPRPISADGAAIGVMLVSIGMTLALVRAQGRVIERTRSVAIKGDRSHYMADLLSNAAAIVGLAAAKLTGDTRWDAAAGLVIALWLVKGAIDVLREASYELLDRETDASDRQRILALALDDADVMGVHQFRSRTAGPNLHVQMHMELEASLTLFHAHTIVERAEQRILAAYPNADLVIHADPFGLSEEHAQDFDGLPVGNLVGVDAPAPPTR